jgi:hypothetical protein
VETILNRLARVAFWLLHRLPFNGWLVEYHAARSNMRPAVNSRMEGPQGERMLQQAEQCPQSPARPLIKVSDLREASEDPLPRLTPCMRQLRISAFRRPPHRFAFVDPLPINSEATI